MYDSTESLDHESAVGLGVVRRTHLPDLTLKVIQRTRERQGSAPLTRSGFGGELLGAFLLVVVGLRHRCVGLVRASGRDTLVLVVDARRCAERLLQAMRAEQRRRPPLTVDVEHATGDFDVSLLRDLLHDQFHREQGRKIVRSDGVHAAGVQRRRGRNWQVGHDVVPSGRHLVLGQHVLVLANGVIHGSLLT